MNTEILTIETPELQAIEKSKADQIIATFKPMTEMLKGFEDAYNSVISESKKEITREISAKAKRLRLDIGRVRIDTGKLKDKQKEYIKLEDKAIMGVHNILVWAVKEKEDKLKEIEDFAENQEREKIQKIESSRISELSQYTDNPPSGLGLMDDTVYSHLLAGMKSAKEAQLEAERLAEIERIENERLDKLEYKRKLDIAPFTRFLDSAPELRSMSDEDFSFLISSLIDARDEYDVKQESIRKENERLVKEAEAAKVKADNERKAAEAKRIEEQRIVDEKLEEQRKETARLQKEINDKAEAERKAKEAEEARIAKEKADAEAKIQADLQRGDKEKIKQIKSDVVAIKLPEVKSAKAKKVLENIKELTERLCKYIDENADTL